jgi:hypothetical protein
MKKILSVSFVVLLMSQTAPAIDLCSGNQIKILEDQKFVEKFLDKYKLDECRSIQIYKKKSDHIDCIANIKIQEKVQIANGEFPYAIIDCSPIAPKIQ